MSISFEGCLMDVLWGWSHHCTHLRRCFLFCCLDLINTPQLSWFFFPSFLLFAFVIVASALLFKSTLTMSSTSNSTTSFNSANGGSHASGESTHWSSPSCDAKAPNNENTSSGGVMWSFCVQKYQ
jgi:hypothetical protein